MQQPPEPEPEPDSEPDSTTTPDKQALLQGNLRQPDDYGIPTAENSGIRVFKITLENGEPSGPSVPGDTPDRGEGDSKQAQQDLDSEKQAYLKTDSMKGLLKNDTGNLQPDTQKTPWESKPTRYGPPRQKKKDSEVTEFDRIVDQFLTPEQKLAALLQTGGMVFKRQSKSRLF